MVLEMVDAPAPARDRPAAVETPARLFRARCREWAAAPALCWKERGIWRSASWADYYARAQAVGLALADHGCRRGDVVAILAENRPEWAYVEFGALAVGVVVAAIHPDSTRFEVARAIAACRPRLVFVEDAAQRDKVEVGDDIALVMFDTRRLRDHDRRGIIGFADFVATAAPAAGAEWFESVIDAVTAADDALIVYGDGDLAPPQPRILSNGEVMARLAALSALVELPRHRRNLTLLSFSDPGARIAGLYLQLAKGTILHFPERPDTVLNDIVEVQPHLLFAPPRFWEKLQARVELTMRAAIRPAQSLYRQACRGGRIAGSLVFPRLRASLGLSRLECAMCTGHIAPDLRRWLVTLGVEPIDASAQAWQEEIADSGAHESIEALLRLNPLVADARLFPVRDTLACAVLLDGESAITIAQERRVVYGDVRELAAAAPLQALIQAEIDRVNQHIPGPTRITGFRVFAEIVAGEETAMTPRFRINRRLFARHYQSQIEEMTKERES